MTKKKYVGITSNKNRRISSIEIGITRLCFLLGIR